MQKLKCGADKLAPTCVKSTCGADGEVPAKPKTTSELERDLDLLKADIQVLSDSTL